MSVLTRIRRLLSAEAHAAVDRAENPAHMLSEALREQVTRAGEARMAAARAATARDQLARRLARIEDEIAYADSAARSALAADNESVARVALARRRQRREAHAELARQLDRHTALVERMDARRTAIARDVAELRERRSQLVERSHFARAVAEAGGDVDTDAEPIHELVERMERKVAAEEALADHLGAGTNETPDTQLDRFVTEQVIDADLAALRAELDAQSETRA